LVLASGSPQRKLLLESADYSFEVVVPRAYAECGVCSRETPPELVSRLACQKAADVLEQIGSNPAIRSRTAGILACDTVAECLGIVLGKPANRDHARDMLERLSGREHRVYSGLCLWRWGREPCVRVAVTTLQMDPLSQTQIDEYLQSGQWEGKAGAFGFQDRAGWLHLVEGSESNVVGLPLELLRDMLEAN
jgi:septum formation protein